MFCRTVVLLCMALVGRPLHAADPLPRTDLAYRIQVRIDPASRKLRGRQTLTWINRATVPVKRVPIHLYLNAFSHLGTTWMREAQIYFAGWMDRDRFLQQYPDPWGWIDPTAIDQLIGGKPRRARWRPVQPDDGNPLDRTLIEVELPEAIPPGGKLELGLAFSGRLPVPIARTGCTPDFCLVAQWFPKIGVMETAGVRHAQGPRWVAHQFHAPTEFYADFADYDVTIEAPAGWTVGATGRPVGALSKGQIRYVQRAVHDFAIVLGRSLHDLQTAYTPRARGATPVSVRYLLPRSCAHQAARARLAIERTLDLFARRIGPYPYQTLTVVMPPWRAKHTAGMEYPTLITGMPADPLWDRFPLSGFRGLEFTLVHELGHQYFYGLLASNEQEEALLDEGFNSHWDGQGMRALFGAEGSAGWALGRPVDALEFYSRDLARSRHRIHEPMRRRPSWLFHPGTQRDQIYGRGALTLWTAERLFGRRTFDRVFSAYFRAYRFRHPDLDDFLELAADRGDPRVAAFFAEAFSRERVPDFRVVTLTSTRHRAPLGRVVDTKGAVTVTPDNRASMLPRLTDRQMEDAEQKVWVQIQDPGWSRNGRDMQGSVSWHGFRLRGRTARGATLYESQARIVGPAWDNLPVTVCLRFDDGVEVRERWDGRSAWRGYRTVRRARLTAVQIDEGRRIALDVEPQNNGRALEADPRFLADWGGWLTGLVQWLASGVSLWL